MHTWSLLQNVESSGAPWSPGYFAGSVSGASISVVRQYIEQQEEIG